MTDMAQITDPRTGEVTEVAIGDPLYHWRYGPLTVVAEESTKVGLHLDDHAGIVEVPGDAWNPYLHDEVKWWLKTGLGTWLFPAPEGVLRTEGLATHAISESEFVQKLHRALELMSIDDTSALARTVKVVLGVKAVEKELAEKRPRLARLTQQLEHDRARLDAEEQVITRLQEDLQRLCAETEAKRVTLGELEREQTPAILKENQPRIEQLKQDIGGCDKEMEVLTLDIGSKRKAVAPLQKRVAELERGGSALEEQVTKLTARLEELRAEMGARA